MDPQIQFHSGSAARQRDVTSACEDPWIYRPASDLALNFCERNRSLDCERGLTRRFLQAGTWALMRSYLRLAHKLHITGSQNFPAQGPFVLVANHSSHFDALALAASVPRARATDVALLAAGDTFFFSRPRAALASLFLNARPIWRGACGSKALGTLRESLQKAENSSRGPIMVLFPEGTRSRSGEISRFKAGVGALVAGTSIPVVPACLTGAHEAWPPGHACPSPGPISLSIGQAMTFPEQTNQRCAWRQIAAELEQQVRDLSKAAQRELAAYTDPHRFADPVTVSC